MNGTIEIVDASDFERNVIRAKTPAAVVFYATWCPHCKRFLPTFHTLAEEFAEYIRFAMVDVDRLPELESKHKIGKIPSVLVFHHGKEIQRWVNEQELEVYRRALAVLAPEYTI